MKKFSGRAYVRISLIIFSILLVLIATSSFLFTQSKEFVYATADEYFDGDGSADSPFEIATKADLNQLAELVNAGTRTQNGKLYSSLNYVLTADIDFNGDSFTPIGNELSSDVLLFYVDVTEMISGESFIINYWDSYDEYFYYMDGDDYKSCDGRAYNPNETIYHPYTFTYAFYGSFDGNGHVVSNLSVSPVTGSACSGLFGYAVNAEIKNLGVNNITASGTTVGGIVGEISSSTVTNCAVVSSSITASLCGGIVGKTAEEIEYTVTLGNQKSGALDDLFREFIGDKKEQKVSSVFVSSSTTVSATEYAGGIVGKHLAGEIASAFSAVAVEGQQNAFSLCGYNGAAISDSLVVTAPAIAENDVQGANYLYPNDLFTEETNSNVDSETLATEKPTDLGLSSAWTKATTDDNYYYPTNTTFDFAKEEISFYVVTQDNVVKKLVNVLDTDGAYTLQNVTKSGYEFAYFIIDEQQKNVGDTINITADTQISTFWNLLGVNTADVSIPDNAYVGVYDGTDKTAFSVYYTDGYSRKFLYQWYYSAGDGEYTLLEGQNGNYVTVRYVDDSGWYACEIVIVKDEDVNLATDIPVSYTVKKQVFINKLDVKVKVNALYDGNNYATYTGENFNLTLSYQITQGEIFEGDVNRVADGLKYVFTNNGSVANAIKNAGSYQIGLNNGVSDYNFIVENDVFTVNKASITATINEYDKAYDGLSHGIEVKNITTVDGVYTVEFSTDGINFSTQTVEYTDVTTAYVHVKITCDNHEDFTHLSKINITPLEITLSAKQTYDKITKIYDGLKSFNVSEIENIYDVSYANDYDGESPVVVEKAVSNTQNAGEITVTASFSVGSNFTLTSDTVDFLGEIIPATVTISPKKITAEYNNSTDFTSAITADDYTVSSNGASPTNINIYSAIADGKTVGDTSLTVKFNNTLGGNFAFSNENCEYVFDLEITPKKLTVDTSLITAQDRAYDGTNQVVIVASEGAFSGFITGDEQTVVLNGIISDVNASDNPYQVTLTEITVDGNNYYVDKTDIGTLTVVISKAEPIFDVRVENSTVYPSTKTLPGAEITEINGECTVGEITWDTLFLTTDGTIDFTKYNMVDGLVAFGYEFTPTDGTNYTTKKGEYTFTYEEIKITSIAVDYNDQGITHYAFDVVSPEKLTVKAVNNDGSETTISYGVNGYRIEYENGTSLTVGDEYFTVLYGTSNDDEFSQQVSVSVNKIILTTPYGKSTFTYNGSSHRFTPLAYDNALMHIVDNEGTNKGKYQATVTLNDTANYIFDNGQNYVSLEWEILALVKYELFIEKNTFVYDGTEKEIVIRNDNNATKDFYTVSGDSTATNVGTYTVTFTLINDNYFWANHEQQEYSLEWNITPLSVQKPVLNKTEYTFDNQQRTVMTNDTEYYVLSGSLSYLDAGSYQITADLVDKNNYVWADNTTDKVTLNYVVNKLVVNKPYFNTTYLYTGQTYLVATTNDYGGYYLSGTLSARNVGMYSFFVLLKNENNYVWADETSESYEVTWNISKRTVSLPSLSGNNGYTGREQTALITYDATYATISGNVATDSGEYQATVTLKDKNNTIWNNGTVQDVTVKWKITPTVIAVPSAPSHAFYCGLDQTATIPVSSAYSIYGATQKEIGVYTITVALNDVNNYVWATGDTQDLSYEWKILSLTLVSNGKEEQDLSYVLGQTLPTPYCDGYVFDGWYDSADFSGEKITVLTDVDESVKLYAKWTEKTSSGIEQSKQESVLSTKAIIGIGVAGGAVVVALLIIILGVVLKRASGGKPKKSNKNDTPSLF